MRIGSASNFHPKIMTKFSLIEGLLSEILNILDQFTGQHIGSIDLEEEEVTLLIPLGKLILCI